MTAQRAVIEAKSKMNRESFLAESYRKQGLYDDAARHDRFYLNQRAKYDEALANYTAECTAEKLGRYR